MRRWLVVAIAGALVSGGAATASQPTLRSAVASKRHVVVTFAPGELAPALIAVATRPARAANGGFVATNVRLRERITANADPATGDVRYRTRGTVPRGTYYVAVSGILQEPPVSCIPIRSHCAERWSNVLRLVVAPAA
jgi:hypothetical protein